MASATSCFVAKIIVKSDKNEFEAEHVFDQDLVILIIKADIAGSGDTVAAPVNEQGNRLDHVLIDEEL